MDILKDEDAETLSSLNSSKGDRQSNLRPLYPGGLLMPAAEIEIFAGGLHVSESTLVQHLLQMVYDAMSEAGARGLMTSDIRLIREMAAVYEGESYQGFMQKVVAALDGGPAGVLAASKTVKQAIDLLNHFPPDVLVLRKVNEVWVRISQPEQTS
jgi:hypothetical protein